MNVKLNTLKHMSESSKVKKTIIQVTCGSTGTDYVRLGNRSDDFSLGDYFNEFSNLEKAEIGIQLIRSGQTFRKENKGKWVQLTTSKGNELLVYFSKDNDKSSNSFLTHSRCAIATAKETSAILAEKEDMPPLGLNLGWHSLTKDSTFNSINAEFIKMNMPIVSKETIYMISIPKLKPHKYLDLNLSEASLMIVFHIFNDAFNTTKRKDDKMEMNFTSDIYSKLTSLNLVVSRSTVKVLLKIILPKCLKTMKHKGTVPNEKHKGTEPNEIISIVKTIVKAMQTGKPALMLT